MKFRGNKGQGAMEYLMTYGWAILVVMIVGVVLWQLGVFNVGQGSVVAKDWEKLQVLGPTVSYQSTDQSFTVSFNNVVGTAIRITNVTAAETYGGKTCTTGATLNDATHTAIASGLLQDSGTDNPATVTPGAAFQYNTTCTGGSTLNAGDQYLMTITITYDSVVGGIQTPHSETGTIRGNAE